MKTFGRIAASGLVAFFLLSCSTAAEAAIANLAGTLDGGQIGWRTAGGMLPGNENYNWWYGCSPTSAGMMAGYYDHNGYAGLTYHALVPGGAEGTTYPSGMGNVNNIIASAGYIHDFYHDDSNRGYTYYGASGDDLAGPWHSFNSLADFMGTSQDAVGNTDGSTMFYYWTNGQAFTAQDASTYGVWQADGMYGIGEYLQYATYDYASLFTQLIYSPSAPYGFTFQQFKAEIDAGRPMLIQIANETEGHTMFGYGYDEIGGNNIHFYDTWDALDHAMAWGGIYSSMQQWGVVGLTLSGGDSVQAIPEPATQAIWLVLGMCGVFSMRRRGNGPSALRAVVGRWIKRL